jgi:hypothetical protein
MSSYQGIRRKCLASMRRSGAAFVYLLASSGIVPVPPTGLNDPAAPGAEPASPDLACAPLAPSERRAWRQLVSELSAKPKRDRLQGVRSWMERGNSIL